MVVWSSTENPDHSSLSCLTVSFALRKKKTVYCHRQQKKAKDNCTNCSCKKYSKWPTTCNVNTMQGRRKWYPGTNMIKMVVVLPIRNMVLINLSFYKSDWNKVGTQRCPKKKMRDKPLASTPLRLDSWGMQEPLSLTKSSAPAQREIGR